jgi:two-component system, OmpR family, response regulator
VVEYLRVFCHVGFFCLMAHCAVISSENGSRFLLRVTQQSRHNMEVLTMSAVLMKDRLPSEVGDTHTYNRLQMRRSIQAHGDPTAEEPDGTTSELLRVLIVDDYRSAADTLAMLVDVWGHDVRCAYDGTSALALAAEFQPNVMLLDISMPNMSGLELAVQLRRQPRLNECFMIAVTGRTDAGHRLQCEEAGIDLFLIKPVGPSILQTLLLLESDYVLRTREDLADAIALPRSARNLINRLEVKHVDSSEKEPRSSGDQRSRLGANDQSHST